MALQLSSKMPALENEVRFSYLVKKAEGKLSRVGFARVLDMSETGLCMEISPYDSDLFMESCGASPVLNKDIELQIYCRSHPSNVFVEGSVKWFKQKKELDASSDEMDLCAGVVFSICDNDQKKQLTELLGHLNSDIIHCKDCETPVSIDASFCYSCGAKLLRRRDALKEAISSLLANDECQAGN